MTGASRSHRIVLMLLAVLLAATTGFAQAAPSQQNIPDAPSTQKKPSALPQAPAPQPQPPQAPPASPVPAPAATDQQPAPPMPEVKTVPQGAAVQEQSS